MPPAADFALTHALVHSAERLGVPFRVGPIATIDVFIYFPLSNIDARYKSRFGLAG